MELYQEILAQAIGKEVMRVILPHFPIDAAEVVEWKSYLALKEIKAAIEDDSLSEFYCIERIVCILEGIGSDGGFRHDV